MVWKEAEDLQKQKTPLVLTVLDVNKGGLVLEWNGVQGFLPTSQLKPIIILAFKMETRIKLKRS